MNSGTVDLTNCEREPIHIPGAIQPHGVLIVFRVADLVVTHVSENATSVIGMSPTTLLGQPVGQIFASDEAGLREAILQREVLDTRPVYLFTNRVRRVTQPFDAIAHRHGDHIFLELEPAVARHDKSAPEFYRLVQKAISRTNSAASVKELYDIAAQHVRDINGFDRVMIYRFDDDWNGQVVAEDKRSDLEPFLGLHYPASDIPKQARELYTKNWLRFIADRDYIPARILPETGPDSSVPLDMSFSVLRSVSPIHLEYLKNMGVGASMSISLVCDNRLWGLIACHHYSPRFVPYDIRTACELLGQYMSLSLAMADDREHRELRESMRDTSVRLTSNVERSDDMVKAMIEGQPTMLDLIDAEGAAIVIGDNINRIGQTPGDDALASLSAWLTTYHSEDVFSTDNLQSHFGSGLLGNVASGLLAISLGTSQPQQLLWFRTEKIRTVEWAGDPAKSVIKSSGESRLSPRGSFSLWKETVRGRSRPWIPTEIQAAFHLREGLMRQFLRRNEQLALANKDLRLASSEREKLLESERAARSESERLNRMKDEFVATLSHELRTPLNAILGWTQLMKLRGGLAREIEEGINVIHRNARSQAQMIEDLLDVSRIISGKLSLSFQETHLPSIVESAIETIILTASAKGIRVEKLIDPLLEIQTTGDPGRLQQIVWNLLSNAVKFTPHDGKIQVVLERVRSHVELSISDSGEGIAAEFLPHVFDRFQQADSSSSRKHGGLGLGLSIVRNLVELHGGNVRAFSAGLNQGSTFTVSLPIRALRYPEHSHHAPGLEPSTVTGGDRLNLAGIHALCLDDENDARELIGRILEECGCEVVSASTIPEALAHVEKQKFDIVISDIGMPGHDGYQFARELRELESRLGRSKAPAVALTAYARAEDRRKALLAGFQAHVAKPIETGEFLAVVASLCGRL